MTAEAMRRENRDALADRVERLEAIVADLVAQVAALGAPRAWLGAVHVALLQQIAMVTEGRPFTTRQLFAYLRVAPDPVLARALFHAGISTPRELGWLLRRSRPHVGDLTIYQCGTSHRDGCLWQVVRAPRSS